MCFFSCSSIAPTPPPSLYQLREYSKRVGITPRVSVLALFPFVNLFGLWFFAFSHWPSDAAGVEQGAEWSEADKEKFRQLMRQQ